MNQLLRRAFVVIVLGLLVPATLFAQETNQSPNEGSDDGRINFNYWMDGMGLYCINSGGSIATSPAGGGLLLLLEGTQILFVPAAKISSGYAQALATNQFATLGVAAEDAYFSPPPAIYVLPDGTLQANVAKSSPDDLREGKIYEFQFTSCRGTEVPIVDQLPTGTIIPNDGSILAPAVAPSTASDAAPAEAPEAVAEEAPAEPVAQQSAPVVQDAPAGNVYSSADITADTVIQVGDIIDGKVVIGIDGNQIFVVSP